MKSTGPPEVIGLLKEIRWEGEERVQEVEVGRWLSGLPGLKPAVTSRFAYS